MWYDFICRRVPSKFLYYKQEPDNKFEIFEFEMSFFRFLCHWFVRQRSLLHFKSLPSLNRFFFSIHRVILRKDRDGCIRFMLLVPAASYGMRLNCIAWYNLPNISESGCGTVAGDACGSYFNKFDCYNIHWHPPVWHLHAKTFLVVVVGGNWHFTCDPAWRFSRYGCSRLQLEPKYDWSWIRRSDSSDYRSDFHCTCGGTSRFCVIGLQLYIQIAWRTTVGSNRFGWWWHTDTRQFQLSWFDDELSTHCYAFM